MAEFFFPVLVTALYDRWRANAQLQAAGVAVYDGPADNQDDAGRIELFVGASGEDYGDGEDAGATDQEWANANTTERDSYEQVVCGLWWTQDGPNMATVRAGVAGALAVIAADLRADVTVGGAVSFHAELASVRWRQIQTEVGPRFGAVFTVRAWSRVYM
ncbi:hypothetical protein [Micromonospora aurantiaca (nom. illeg.)]|uniref:hypothetical protein n=2 Tax=Micromonospora aurantiaca (nom. illeg.) TaxID=47850 RepID=UPI00340532AE